MSANDAKKVVKIVFACRGNNFVRVTSVLKSINGKKTVDDTLRMTTVCAIGRIPLTECHRDCLSHWVLNIYFLSLLLLRDLLHIKEN